MSRGVVAGLFVGAEPGGPVEAVDEFVAVAGRGIRGDRYFDAGGNGPDPTEEVTVFAAEAIEAARQASGVAIDDRDLRRNIMTRGVEVAALIGTTFRVGDVVIEGLEDNPPCAHLQQLAGTPLLEPLVGAGGLRGRIVTGGTVRAGDPVETVPL